ncbi:probable methyltransferase PMT23 [Elaeis guineensis]|uniref:Methyltransferase n=1 Tax=Elaeis guineensis var. tenera TaxID=51953 RepID=A0A6I9R9L3_ELAGV|nr:probable methyltransferase PMT23 [Elaeis guineensis]
MPSIRNLLTERKYPFLLALAFFLLSILLLFLFSNPTNSLFSSYFPSLGELQASTHPLPPPPSRPSPIPSPDPLPNANPNPIESVEDVGSDEVFEFRWEICQRGKGFDVVDYIPCLDNIRAIKELKSRRHMEHRERRCPKPSPSCLVPLPPGYKVPVPWPKSRDMIWYNNVPHPKLVEYKKDQNWVQRSGDYLVFPGGGTQFKQGVTSYIQFIEQILPTIEWGRRTRVILDVGCGVASFGGCLLDKNVITMSFAPKDEHEAQIQFALERGIPAFLSVIGTQKLTFPDNVFDLIHCARCRVHWDANGGKPLLDLNRILRPGGFFVWSATPVYRDNTRDQTIWNAMVLLTDSICWKMVVKSMDATGIGVVIYQKPVSNSCYEQRKINNPSLCLQKDGPNISWYAPLDSCLSPLPNRSGKEYNWPISWPERLKTRISSVPQELNGMYAEEKYDDDMKHWETLVSEAYLHDLGISWSSIRNVMDMNAGFGGFAAALINQPLWVMNVVPVHGPDTLPIIFNRGLIGIYHDWCEAFNTYPRTYDLLHSTFLFGTLTQRCNIIEVVAEMDRILRPGKWILIQDSIEMIRKMHPILQSLHYETTLYKRWFLVGKKDFWRPDHKESTS